MKASAHFEVAVIGGGVLGTAIGYYLARLGIKSALFESGTVGGRGATSYSGGIVRTYDPDSALMRLSARGCLLMSNWERLGYPGISPLSATGMVYLLKPENVASAVRSLETIDRDDYPVTIHDGQPARRFHDWIGKHHQGVVLHEPLSGFGNARQTALNLAIGMRSAGGDLFEHCTVDRIHCQQSIWWLHFGNRKVSCDRLVVAAGALSRQIQPTLPIRIRNISMLQMANHCPAPLIDELHDVYVTPHSQGGSLGGSIQFREVDALEDLPSYDQQHESHTLERIDKLTAGKISPNSLGGFTGYDSYTNSYRPIVGRLAGQPGLYMLCGASGRGFKYSLAIGESLASEIAADAGVDALADAIPTADFRHPVSESANLRSMAS